MPHSLQSPPAGVFDGARVAPLAPLPLMVVAFLVVAYCLPVVLAYGPWKPDEPYIFGLVNHLLKTGDWVVPTLAGEPFMEKPPLMVWVAALTASVLSPWLDLEYGARFAILIFLAITFVTVGYTARRLWGVGSGRYAVLGMMAAMGMMQNGRMLVPDLPQMAGFAVTFAGLIIITERKWLGGVLLGTGAGLSFLGKGLLGPGVLTILALSLPLVSPYWRTQQYLKGLLIAFVVSLLWLLIWPIAVYLRSPELFIEWFMQNNIGRFLGFSVARLGAAHDSGHLIKTIPWFTFPLLPLAILTVWRLRDALDKNRGVAICSLAFLIMLATFAFSASAREVYLLPMLIPLAILAVPAALDLPAKLEAAFDWLARLLFGALLLLCWYLWFTAIVLGAPPQWSVLAKHLPLNFPLVIEPLAMVAGGSLLAGWLWMLCRAPTMSARLLLSWAGGAVVLWATVFALLLPWIDAARSYQRVFTDLAQHMPANQSSCLSTSGLGESERGMLEYIVEVDQERIELSPNKDCPNLLLQSRGEVPALADAENWKLVWQGARPAEVRERFWLFQRIATPQEKV